MQSHRFVAKKLQIDKIEDNDYNLTFYLILPVESLKLTISLASISSIFKWNIQQQLDVKVAYLNVKLENDIYMTIPEWGGERRGCSCICHFNKGVL